MLGWLLLLFILVPLVEVYLLIEIAGMIGFWNTVGIVVLTGLLGAALVKAQGPKAWFEVVKAMREGRPPGIELLAGALFLVGAAFLLTPGVITDGVGFLLMVPIVRKGVAKLVAKRFRGSATVTYHRLDQPPGPP